MLYLELGYSVNLRENFEVIRFLTLMSAGTVCSLYPALNTGWV